MRLEHRDLHLVKNEQTSERNDKSCKLNDEKKKSTVTLKISKPNVDKFKLTSDVWSSFSSYF